MKLRNPLRMTKAGRILNYIRRHPEGLALIEIQKFYAKINGRRWVSRTQARALRLKNYDDGSLRARSRSRRGTATEGYMNTYLVESEGRLGILPTFCMKLGNRWYLNSLYHRGVYTSVEGAQHRVWTRRLDHMKLWREREAQEREKYRLWLEEQSRMEGK